MQIAFGVFANAEIQCEESVSSSTPQNRTYRGRKCLFIFTIHYRFRFFEQFDRKIASDKKYPSKNTRSYKEI